MLALLLALLGLLGLPGMGAVAHGKSPGKLGEILGRELGLTSSLVKMERGLVALERAEESATYAASVLEHGGKESLRRLESYRVSRSAREGQTRRRARALYKLARGGMLRIAFEDPRDGDTARRIAKGRTVRWLVRHDLRELSVHRRAEDRARAELLAAARELQALGTVTMMMDLQRQALGGVVSRLEPEVEAAHRERRRVARRSSAGRQERELMALIARERRSLRGEGLDLLERRALVRPVRGGIVGRFGTYEDRILRVPMVRNGIELRARARSRVRAVAAGEVAFVGELPGFGQVVVVDHGGGYLTLTGRLLRTDVAPGDAVEPGTVVGTVAPSAVDNGLGDTVYLELRHGDRPVDPSPYLR